MKKYNLRKLLSGGLLAALLVLQGCTTLPETVPEADNSAETATADSTDQKKAAKKPATTKQPPIAKKIAKRPQKKAVAKPKPSLAQANQLAKQGRRAEAAAMYYRAAFNYASPKRQRIVLQAAEISASLGNRRKAQHYLRAAPLKSLKSTQSQARYRYVESLLAIQDKKPTRALRLLPRNTSGLAAALAKKIELVRRRALKMGGKPVQATVAKQPAPARNKTAQQNQIAQRQQAVRPRLPHYPHVNIDRTSQQKPVNRAAQQQARPPQQAQRQQTQQRSMNSGFALPQATNKIALLLPSQGALGKVGDEIYRGVQDAQARYGATTLSKRYNVNKGNALAQYQQAVTDGADIVVGPLDKGSLATLMTQPQMLRTPLLSLNYLPGSSNVPTTLYQFGLSPEDEARQIAEFAIARGQVNGIIMTPDSSWGKRLANAFAQTYQQRGGRILNAEFYPNSAPSTYLKRVKTLLSKAAGANMAFLAASPTQARLLRPLLKDQAGPLPVYATSHIYSGRESPNKDIDLDGIIYTEIPLILENTGKENESLSQLQYPRLYALGMDSVLVAKSLPQLVRRQGITGKTGQIRMDPQRRVQRQLNFATFDRGLPKKLGN